MDEEKKIVAILDAVAARCVTRHWRYPIKKVFCDAFVYCGWRVNLFDYEKLLSRLLQLSI